MKNFLKVFGIIALVAVIGFSFVACDNGVSDVPVTGVTLDKSSIFLTVGGSATLTETVTPENATNKAVTWSTNNAAAATVSNGVVTAVAAGTATITVTTADGGKTDTCSVTITNFDITALNAVIQEAGIAREGIAIASDASEVATGRKWVTESEWNAFDTAYKAAVETKADPLNDSAVETAKTNLQAALNTFNAAKKDGTAAAIKLSGTITVKNNGQIVPYVLIQAHNNDWSWSDSIEIHLTAANTPWEIITKPFSSSEEISFNLGGTDDNKNSLFYVTADVKKTVYNTDVNNIAINMDFNLITISGTFNFDYGKIIPSVGIEIYKKDNGACLGGITIYNFENSAAWSTNIPSQTADTDIVFNIVGFDGPLKWEYDQLFAIWGGDFGVKVGSQNKTGIALNLITLSGTINVTYKGNNVPIVELQINKKISNDNWEWVTNTTLNNPSANAQWSIIIPAFTSDTEIKVDVKGKDGDDNQLFWVDATTKTVKNTNVSGIALNFISISGTINVKYKGNNVPIVEMHILKRVYPNSGEWIANTTLNNPSENAPWSFIIPAFTSDTVIYIDLDGYQDEDTQLFHWYGVEKTVKNTDVSGIVVNVGNITE